MNPYIEYNKEHAYDNKNTPIEKAYRELKKKEKLKIKQWKKKNDRQKWWKSLSKKEQDEYINKMKINKRNFFKESRGL